MIPEKAASAFQASLQWIQTYNRYVFAFWSLFHHVRVDFDDLYSSCVERLGFFMQLGPWRHSLWCNARCALSGRAEKIDSESNGYREGDGVIDRSIFIDVFRDAALVLSKTMSVCLKR